MRKKKENFEKIEKAAAIFKGLGNVLRIKIINTIQDKELKVKDIAESLGYEQPFISQQIKILKIIGIIKRVKSEEGYRYKLTNPHFSKIIKCMRNCLETQKDVSE